MKKIAIVLLSALIICTFSGCSSKAKKTVNKPDITQIRSICNLATLECYYHNVAKDNKEPGSGISHIGEVERKYWIEYTGIAKIGIDISEVDIQTEGNKVTVIMPEAKLLSIDIRDSDLNENSYISNEDSRFNSNKITAEDQTAAINKAQLEMAESVKNNSTLLLNAQSRAQELIKNYIVQIGTLSGTEYEIEWKYESNSEQNTESTQASESTQG